MVTNPYEVGRDRPEDHIQTIRSSDSAISQRIPNAPSFGLDNPAGLLQSNITAPLYLYASLRGKHRYWAEQLEKLPDGNFLPPSLDVGCGRGAVLLKVTARKMALKLKGKEVAPAYGTDIFASSLQTGNSPRSTYLNVAAAGALDFVVLHTADIHERLPFADGVFGLVTSCLVLHHAKDTPARRYAFREIARVCAPGGVLLVVDLHWIIAEHFSDYQAILEELGWVDVRVAFTGLRMQYGLLPCQALKATKQFGESMCATQVMDLQGSDQAKT
jgi:SAM-dependent methyltransferase